MKDYLGAFDPPENHEYANYGPQEWALEYISHYGYIDGAHHKQWVLDQVARILMGTPVVVTQARWEGGEAELRFETGEPSKAYREWIGDDIEDEEATGSPP